MKLLILSLLITVSLLTACKKQNSESSSQTLVGRWELRQIIGSQIANAQTKFGRGNGRVVEFTETEYRNLENDKLTYADTYQLATASQEIDGRFFDQVFITGKYNFKNYFTIKGKMLTISNGTMAADGVTLIYERL